MIDTITMMCSGALRREYLGLQDLPLDWQCRACGYLSPCTELQSVIVECKRLDLRIWGCGRGFNRIEANLPKLLFGHNGQVITTAEQLECSIQWLEYLVGLIMTPAGLYAGFFPGRPTPIIGNHFTRIDLAYQFPAEAGVFLALSNASHPRIRSQHSLMKGQTVHLKGSFLEILAYEKVRQMRIGSKVPNDVHRLEFRLKNRALSELYLGNGNEGYGKLTFDWCRDVMRKLACETQAPPLLGKVGKVCHFLAAIDAEAPLLDVVDKYIHYRGLRRDTARKLRKEVESVRRADVVTLKLSDYFPQGDWPPPKQIELPEVEAAHRSWMARLSENMRSHLQDLSNEYRPATTP